MESGIYIRENKLIFVEYPSKDIGGARFCESFTIDLTDIKFIAISPRLALDDETLFILIITKDKKILPMPEFVLSSEEIKEFEKYFQINSIAKEWSKFSYNDHYGKYDKIIFPHKLYWQNLFINNWKLKIRRLYGTLQTKSFLGTIINFD